MVKYLPSPPLSFFPHSKEFSSTTSSTPNGQFSSNRVYPPRSSSVSLISSFFGILPKNPFTHPLPPVPHPPSFIPQHLKYLPTQQLPASPSSPQQHSGQQALHPICSRSVSKNISLPRLLSFEGGHPHDRHVLYHRALPEQLTGQAQHKAQPSGGVLAPSGREKKFHEHVRSRQKWRWFLGKHGRRNLALCLVGGMAFMVTASFAAKGLWFSDTEEEKMRKMQERLLQERRERGGGWSEEFWTRLDEIKKHLGNENSKENQ
eukprot:GHVS01030080.1.p1 GENE.GHVS01030080.1~~GHVS01030080.1.p1  ORF type:complete len:261 (+),score=53.37 GHVS01030080.1:340-1122(+)